MKKKKHLKMKKKSAHKKKPVRKAKKHVRKAKRPVRKTRPAKRKPVKKTRKVKRVKGPRSAASRAAKQAISESVVQAIIENNSEYAFINPLLFYQIPSDDVEYKTLASKIQNLIGDSGDKKTNLTASVYYRDLNTGRWFGINENDKYTPASLLKVVVMIAYFKEAEIQPSVLSRWILFSKSVQDLIGSIPYDQGTELQLNRSYLVSDLIDRMIIKSDNGATYALLSQLDDLTLGHVFSSLGLQNPQETGRSFTLSAQDYATFFRILYNATYLNRPMSERALSLLSRTEFKDGLVAGVPQNILVSHKYGEAVITETESTTDSVELHDCGIVYHPKNPYLLCIMTRGKGSDQIVDLKEDAALIKNISQVIYDDINNQ